jgi:hypothetical protein
MNVNKEYKPLIKVPIGTEMIVLKTGLTVKLEEIRYFPTRYKCDDGNYYYTHAVDIIDWLDTVGEE